ncbi:unnamed protein product [Rotaria magnacalcarata]|nr:unnamed protein product [Rotaria magnacalcarata]CAF1380488.1 unnamed protein product [Rotaria magnacalcarata]CAF1953824.1 unnamed protein product [Rotaria magnacalcarata]CAF4322763.1 unnamed protein product [Rotaria magnacalcarata]
MCSSKNVRHQFLREQHEANDAELIYLDRIYDLRHKQRENANSHRELSEILDLWLYQGNWEEANDLVLLDRLAISHIVNVTSYTINDSSRRILHISSREGRSADLLESFNTTNSFLDKCREQGQRTLVHCNRGVSRSSTIVLAYLMYHKNWPLLQAYEYLLIKRPQALPNPVLFLQLIRYEARLNIFNMEN